MPSLAIIVACVLLGSHDDITLADALALKVGPGQQTLETSSWTKLWSLLHTFWRKQVKNESRDTLFHRTLNTSSKPMVLDQTTALGRSVVTDVGSRLAFMHIPKTAGTTIEDVGIVHGVRWGRRQMHWGMQNMSDGHRCSSHHVPPAFAQERVKQAYTGINTFCITRDPYERLVSEYAYQKSAPLGHLHNHSGFFANASCTSEDLNIFISRALTAVLSGDKFVNDCHFVPQSEYIWEGEKQWCTYILRMDGLPWNFNSLMEDLGMDVKLEEEDRSNPSWCSGMSTAWLTNDTKSLIRQVYHDDFITLGYSDA